MQIASGVLLVLASWAALAVFLMALGLPAALLTQRGRLSPLGMARAAWWGLLLVTLLAMGLNQWLPLRSAYAGVIVLAVTAAAGTLGRLMLLRRGSRADVSGVVSWPVVVAVLLVAVALAASAVGPLTNTDSGLYHLGAIRYSGDFAAIPGLSNLYGPLGYGTATFPLAALLGNGPWGLEGPRLLNGLLILLVGLDLVARSMRRNRGAGFYVELVGFTVLAIPMVAIADFWVTSPTQDAGAFALTIVATAALADAVTRRRSFPSDAGVVVAVSILMVLIKPTMAVFAIVALAVLLGAWWRIRHGTDTRAVSGLAALTVGAGIAAAGLSLLRDRTLSGWWLYPLSILPFEVPWRAADPTELRQATLGYHRNPEDLWGSIEGWAWVGPWISRLPHYWETWLLAGSLILAVIVLLAAARQGSLRWRMLIACIAPSLVATAAWFVASPPSFRFAWGPVLTLGAIPVGWGLWRQRSRRAPIVAAAMIGAIAVLSLVSRTEWSSITEERAWRLGVSIPYAVTPLPDVPTDVVEVSGGLQILVPTQGEQCWAVFPLCTPRVDPDLRLLGTAPDSGFLP